MPSVDEQAFDPAQPPTYDAAFPALCTETRSDRGLVNSGAWQPKFQARSSKCTQVMSLCMHACVCVCYYRILRTITIRRYFFPQLQPMRRIIKDFSCLTTESTCPGNCALNFYLFRFCPSFSSAPYIMLRLLYGFFLTFKNVRGAPYITRNAL